MALERGRLILVNSVLTNLPVYWMSICRIPKTILNAINYRIFNFIWDGLLEHTKFHLISWDKMEKPKEIGGWAIRNIYLFSRSTNAKILWRTLFLESLWHRAILAKYFKTSSIEQWIRNPNKPKK